MPASLPARLLAWIYPASVLVLAGYAATHAPRPSPSGPGTAAVRDLVVHAVRAKEAGFRRTALEQFPGDPWSQGDQFAADEATLIERLAGEHALRIGAVLDAIDHDVKHGRPDLALGDRGRVAPCMPRPFYD